MKQSNKAIVIGSIEDCPKCEGKMERRKHPPHYVHRKSYYYTEWDFCPRCNHVQHYEHFKSYEWQEQERQQGFFQNISKE